MLDTVVISDDNVCCRVVFDTLIGMFSVMLSELLMTSAISCPLRSSVYECQSVECAFTSPVRTECGMFVMYCMQCCMKLCTVNLVPIFNSMCTAVCIRCDSSTEAVSFGACFVCRKFII